MKIHIIEDKSKNYRGNHDIQMLRIPFIDVWFVAQAQMTYNSFRKFARRVAEHFNAAEVLIVDEDISQELITVCELYDDETKTYDYKFWFTPEDAKSYKDRIYYTKEELKQRVVNAR